MQKIIKNSEKIDLTDGDILRMVDGKVKIIEYKELNNAMSIEPFLEPYGNLIILYETREGFGHWVCLIKRGINHVEFFDSYGLKVDEELDIINEANIRRNTENQIQPHLTELLRGYRVDENLTKLQKFLEDVNTCGRHVAVRILMKRFPIRKYENLICCNKNGDADWYVSALTYFL